MYLFQPVDPRWQHQIVDTPLISCYIMYKAKSMSISINGVTLWNDLDQHIYDINSLLRFRNIIKKMFINSYRLTCPINF